MCFNLDKVFEDKEFSTKFFTSCSDKLIDNGWKGEFEAEELINDNNFDALHNTIHEALSEIAEEVYFDESDGGGIPGSADFVYIYKLFDKYFIFGSSIDDEGPLDTLEEAEDFVGFG